MRQTVCALEMKTEYKKGEKCKRKPSRDSC